MTRNCSARTPRRQSASHGAVADRRPTARPASLDVVYRPHLLRRTGGDCNDSRTMRQLHHRRPSRDHGRPRRRDHARRGARHARRRQSDHLWLPRSDTAPSGSSRHRSPRTRWSGWLSAPRSPDCASLPRSTPPTSSFCAGSEVVNDIAKWRYQHHWEKPLRLVLRMPAGSAGSWSGPEHTQSIEGLLNNVPGTPGRGAQHRRKTPGERWSKRSRSAIPVIFLEHRVALRRDRPTAKTPLTAARPR